MSDLDELCKSFLKYSKRVLKKNISKNPITLHRYEVDLIESYNDILGYVDKNLDKFTEIQTIETKQILKDLRYKFVKCFSNLRIRIQLDKQILKLVTEENILERPYEIEELGAHGIDLTLESDSEGEFSNDEDETVKEIEKSISLLERTLHEGDDENGEGIDNTDNNQNTDNDDNNESIMEPAAVVSLLSKLLPTPYSGDPLALDAFVNSIDLIVTVVGNNHPNIVLNFIKSKLTGKALEAIPTSADTVQKIKDALKATIKPENSKVIAGKMMALRIDNKSKTDFSKAAEELAEAFQRASIVEGIPQAKSKEMAIEETIKMCRNNAKTDLVKGIIAATKFDSPAEVIAKYMVESATEVQEKQILAYRIMTNKNRNGNGNYRGRRYNNNGNRRNNGNNYNNNNRYNNYNNNGNNNNNNGYNGNYRGRGNNNYRGNNYRGNNNRNNYNNNGNRGNNNYNSYDNNDRNVRYAENWESPQRMMLGGTSNNGNSQNNNNNNNNQRF